MAKSWPPHRRSVSLVASMTRPSVHAVKYCLDAAAITPEQLDYVGFYDKPLLKFDRLLEDDRPQTRHAAWQALRGSRPRGYRPRIRYCRWPGVYAGSEANLAQGTH
jgi:hypothetical protein